MESKILRFYLGIYRHPGTGATIDEMWQWDDGRLEGIHGYLTWWFPTRKLAFSAEWEPIRDEEIEQFRTAPELRRRVLKSFYRMLRFYGLAVQRPAPRDVDSAARPLAVGRAENWDERRASWITRDNHNYRRISRILQSLVLLGFKDAADMFLDALVGIYEENRKTIGATTRDFWSSSVSDPRYWNGTL
jgi:hypothetical protein